MLNLETLTLSEHSLQRYSERIMDRETKNEINSFIATNKEKIITDIKKMLEYGALLYSGKPTNDHYKNDCRPVDVYQNGLWIIIVDSNRNNVITLYSIDLKAGDELNALYIEKMTAQLNEAKEAMAEAKQKIEEDVSSYKKEISENESLIANYRKEIKALEKCNESYRGLIEGLQEKTTAAEKDVREIVGALIGKKVF